ncbi:hypothetical protein VCHC50A1_3102, partial [Vibrio cholerae HC-50A1]
MSSEITTGKVNPIAVILPPLSDASHRRPRCESQNKLGKTA